MQYFWLLWNTDRRLTVLHPTLYIKKKTLRKFVQNYDVEKVKNFKSSNVSHFLVI